MIECLSRPMRGEDCRGEPFGEPYRDQLRAACAEDDSIWDIYSTNFGPDQFDANIDKVAGSSANATFVLFDGDELAGMSSFLFLDATRQIVEIGCTYYRPQFRGTGFNRRAKDMMLRRAFECGIRRVEFTVDTRNARSQAAMLKLGAVREGVKRQHLVTWTGFVRDSALFSILKDEWA